MKKIRALIGIICVIGLSFGGFRLTDYALNDDTSSLSRTMMHEFYNQDQIDTLFIGASHCQRGVDTNLIGEELGIHTFNATTGSQPPDASLAILKEAIDLYDLKEVYLEVSHTSAASIGTYKERTSLRAVHLVSDYMRNNLNRFELLLNASSPKQYVNSLWPGRRYNDTILNFSEIAETMKKKASDAYKNYTYDYLNDNRLTYLGNGCMARTGSIKEYQYYTEEGFEPYQTDKLSEDWQNSILEIIKLCQDNDIKITLFETKVSDYELAGEGNYDSFITFVNDLISGTEAEYVDFNLVSDEYLPYSESLFYEADHYNVDGRAQFTNFFISYLKGDIPETAFFSSVEERFASQNARFYGLSYKDDKDEEGNKIRRIHVVANKSEELEFQVEVLPEEGEAYTVINWGDALAEFSVPGDLSGKIKVSWRTAGKPETENSVEIKNK